MLEGIRLTLSHAIEGSLILQTAPKGLFDLDFTIPRSEKFYGAFLQFSGELGFALEGKAFIDNIIDVYGIIAKITFTYEVINPVTIMRESFVTGLLKLSEFKKEIDYTYVPFENSDFKTKLNNRSGIKVPYNRQTSIENIALSGISYDYINLLCQGVSANTVTKAIYWYELFFSILQQITDCDYNILQSTLLGRTEIKDASTNEFYLENGEYHDKLITKGKYIRGWDESDSNISVSLDDAFEELNSIIPIGLGFSIDPSGREIVTIEKREYYFQNIATHELEENTIKDLTKSVAKEFLFNAVEFGGGKQAKEQTPYGLTEYITKVEYSAPVSITDIKLTVMSKWRFDGTGINDIITNFKKTGSTDVEQTDYDEEIFVIDSILSSGTYEGSPYTWKNKKGENFTIDLRENDPSLNYNLDLSPARILVQRYGKWIKIGLDKVEGVLKFNKAENLTTLRTLKSGDTDYIAEFTDIDIAILETPILTGNVFRFNYSLSYEEIKTLLANSYGQWKFWNHIENKTSAGWVKEISTKPTDKETNVELYECVSLAEALGFILKENSTFMLKENGTFMLTE